MGYSLAGAALVSICAFGAHSMASPDAQLPPPPDGSTATVTGCLGRGEAPGTFVLTGVKWTSTNSPAKDSSAHHDAPAERARTAAPAATAETPRAGLTLRLAGAATRLKIEPHVGHTITATGMLAPLDPVVSPGIILPDPPPPGDTSLRTPVGRGTEREEAPPRVLNLRSFTHVAEGCKG